MMINASRFLGLFKRTHIAIPLKPERPGLFKLIFETHPYEPWKNTPSPWCCIRLFSGHVCGLRYVRRSGPSTAVGNVSLLNGAWGGRHEAWSWVLSTGNGIPSRN